jgi:hypothetical protein
MPAIGVDAGGDDRRHGGDVAVAQGADIEQVYGFRWFYPNP